MKTHILIILAFLTLGSSVFAQDFNSDYGVTCGGENEDKLVIGEFSGTEEGTPPAEVIEAIHEEGASLYKNLVWLLNGNDASGFKDEDYYYWGKVSMCFYVQAIKKNNYDRAKFGKIRASVRLQIANLKGVNTTGRKAKIVKFIELNEDAISYAFLFFDPERNKSADSVKAY